MKIEAPTFYLKKRCPACGQGSCLAFLTCPKCLNIIIACEEEGSLFFKPYNTDVINIIGNYIDNICCPTCKSITLHEFRPSKGEEIQKLGFTLNDYE